MEFLIPVLLLVAIFGVVPMVIRGIWANGYVNGTLDEARLWLSAFDRLRVPNWQSLLIEGKDLTDEQRKYANQVYVQAYAIALHAIAVELAEGRRDAVEMAAAEEEKMKRRFEGR